MKHTVKVFVLVGDDGQYEVGNDREQATDNFRDNISEDMGNSRLVELTLDIEMPEPIAARVTVPITAGKLEVSAV